MRYVTTVLSTTTLLATASVHAQQNFNQAPAQRRTAAGQLDPRRDQDQV